MPQSTGFLMKRCHSPRRALLFLWVICTFHLGTRAQDGSSELVVPPSAKSASVLGSRLKVRCTDENLRLYSVKRKSLITWKYQENKRINEQIKIEKIKIFRMQRLVPMNVIPNRASKNKLGN